MRKNTIYEAQKIPQTPDGLELSNSTQRQFHSSTRARLRLTIIGESRVCRGVKIKGVRELGSLLEGKLSIVFRDYVCVEHKIESKIITINSQRVILDSDLAQLYGVSTMRLNEQVTRNLRRFPSDFMFSLSFQEVKNLISQNAISSSLHGGRRKPPRFFTEYGAVMAANVLNSDVAIDASIMIVRVFVRLKAIAQEHADLKARLQMLEQRVAKGFSEHAEELQEIRFALAKLEQPPEPRKRRLGF